jgi:CBS domain-containing protein
VSAGRGAWVLLRTALRATTDVCDAAQRKAQGEQRVREVVMTTRIQPYRGSYLTPSFANATVADAMRTGVMSCPPDVEAGVVARMMATNHIHSVVVEGVHLDPVRGEQLKWGVVSDMDLLRAARAGIEELTAGEIAITDAVTVEPTLPLDEAARLMDEHETAHLIVVDRGRPVGILSTLDVAGVLAWGRA